MAHHTEVSNLSFEWEVVDYNHRTHEYTIKNKVTGEERTLTRERYLELLNEQGDKKK